MTGVATPPSLGPTSEPTAGPAAPSRPARRWRERVKDLLLSLAAGLGLVCLGWLVYAQVSGAQLIVFRTGSMSPELPQGAVAIALPTAAADLSVGDVVTVEPLPGARPVTHRIVSIESVDGRPDARSLVLQGDANEEVDLVPYEVTWAPRVVTGVPRGAGLLDFLQSTRGMLVVASGVGLLVGWALWPAAGPRGGARRALRSGPSATRTEAGDA